MQSNFVVTSPFWLTERKYKHAPWAFSLGSQNPCNWISFGCLFAKTNLSRAISCTWDRRKFMSIHWFNNSGGSCSSQSSLCSHNFCRNILYTTGQNKPSGSNMAATLEEIIRLLTGEFLGSRSLWAYVPFLIRNWFYNGCRNKPNVFMFSLLSTSTGTSISLQSVRTASNMLVCLAQNLRRWNPPRPKSAKSSSCSLSASSMVLLHTDHHPHWNYLLMFLVPVRSSLIHVLQAVVNNV